MECGCDHLTHFAILLVSHVITAVYWLLFDSWNLRLYELWAYGLQDYMDCGLLVLCLCSLFLLQNFCRLHYSWMVDLTGVTTVKDSLKFWQQSAAKMLGNQISVASTFSMKTTEWLAGQASSKLFLERHSNSKTESLYSPAKERAHIVFPVQVIISH